MAYGVTSTGFNRPRLVDIKKQIEDSLAATFGANIDLTPGSVFSQLIGTFADREDFLWQGLEDVYGSEYPDTAFGLSLDNVGAISGVPRLGQLQSVIKDVKLYGTAGTFIPKTTTQFSVLGSPLSVFSLDQDVTLAAGQDCIQLITFSLVPTAGNWKIALNGHETVEFAFNANAATIQAAIRDLQFASGCVVAGDYTSGFTIQFSGPGTGGLMVQPRFVFTETTLVNSSTPVTESVIYTQVGIDQANVSVTAVDAGPTIAPAGTLTVIATPLTGLSGVLSTLDAVVGRDVESDNAYRARRAVSLQVAGAGTVEAIRAKLLNVLGVTAVIVFENVTETTDGQGHPPKSFEAVVQGGDDDDIANAIWAVKPAGIRTDGSTAVVITDSMGLNHTINFSRPTELDVYVHMIIHTNANYPANGDAAMIQDIVDSGNSLGIGKEVVVIPYLISSIAVIPGIETATMYIGLAPSPGSSANIPVAANEIAVFDTTRVTVSHV